MPSQARKIRMVRNGGPMTGCLIHRVTNYRGYIMPLYVLSLFILFYQVFILYRVFFICDCTCEYVCNVSSPATEAE